MQTYMCYCLVYTRGTPHFKYHPHSDVSPVFVVFNFYIALTDSLFIPQFHWCELSSSVMTVCSLIGLEPIFILVIVRSM